MWIYAQREGRLWQDSDLETFYQGYAGAGTGKNNPAMQHVEDIGPLPRGDYEIGAPQDTATHGPYVLRLTPSPDNEMFGRAGFLMHGDSVVHPGTASEGCVIQSRKARTAVWLSGDRQLRVVASLGA